METKLLEVRDAGTFIPVLCVAMKTTDLSERYLLSRMGFHKDTYLIQLVWISRQQTNYDPFKWGDRTMYNAHRYITDNWELLSNGDVIDVEFVLGETNAPKVSEEEMDFI